MAYQVLARKWRPQKFSQLVGQEHVSRSLCNALEHDRLHHAYLFTGTRGVGKTTVARILAKAINCENLKDSNPCGECDICRAFGDGRFLDLIEVDAASRTRVEDTRDLLDNVQYAPNQGRYKVYLIDEVHMLSGHSFNALLKTLEEPPEHVKFLLATTDPQKIPVTVLSRCLQFNLKRLSIEQIDGQMTYILGQEKIEFDAQALIQLARAADGSLRDGLSLLDQSIAYGNGRVSIDAVHDMLGIVAQQPVDKILLSLADDNAVEILNNISAIAELSPDFSDILQQIVRILHRVALAQVVPDFIDDSGDLAVVTGLADKISPENVQLFYQIALIGQRDLDLAPDPRIGFEMVILRMLAFKPVSAKSMINPVRSKAKEKIVDAKVEVSLPPVSQLKNESEGGWAEMVIAMKLTGMTRELANNCVLEKIDENECYLFLSPGHSQLLSPRAEEKLQAALNGYIGKSVKLKISEKKIQNSTPAQQIKQKNEEQQQQAVDSINSDENVLALKEHFDARIMPGTVDPI